MQAPHAYAPLIYFIHALLAGPLDTWPAHFEPAATLGFDHVLIGSLFRPGSAGHTQIISDHSQLHPVLGAGQPAAEVLQRLADTARQHGLTLLVDLDDPDEVARAEGLCRRLVERALAMEGTCTGEHGVGQGKMKYLEAEHGRGSVSRRAAACGNDRRHRAGEAADGDLCDQHAR